MNIFMNIWLLETLQRELEIYISSAHVGAKVLSKFFGGNLLKIHLWQKD
jgi:hypothetical protein